MPIPIATQPKPARKPAVAPQAKVVLGSLRNMARLKAMTRLNTKLSAKTFAVAVGDSSAAKRFAFFQAVPNIMGEYQSPPTRKADTAATRIAQMFRVWRFMESCSYRDISLKSENPDPSTPPQEARLRLG